MSRRVDGTDVIFGSASAIIRGSYWRGNRNFRDLRFECLAVGFGVSEDACMCSTCWAAIRAKRIFESDFECSIQINPLREMASA